MVAPDQAGGVGPVRLGALAVDPARRLVVHADGREEILEPRVMQVLAVLARAEGRIVTRDELNLACWRGLTVSEDAINRVAARIRKLSDGLGVGVFRLETVNKVGYRLVQTDTAPAPAPAAPPVAAAAGPRKVAICVLPFANMSDDPQQDYFSDGITEDIITDLSKVSALSVISRNTAFTYKGRSVDVRRAAAELQVTHVLEGSVRKSGQRVRITAQLIDGATDEHLWADRWDRDLTDIFALQDEISRAIVGALRLRLAPEERMAIERRGTTNAEAYGLYLMARQHYLGGNPGDIRREEAMLRLCRRAVEIDPAYARAWALMAQAQTTLHFFYDRPGDNGLAAAERALDLDPSLAEALAVKARHLAESGRDDEAFAHVEIGLRLAPDSYEANETAGMLCFRRRRMHDAIRYFEKATSLMEQDFSTPGMLVGCYTAVDDPEGARRAARITLARAEKVLEHDRGNGGAMGFVVGALAVLGEAEQVRDWIQRALLADPDNLNMRFNFACSVSAHFQDVETALDLLGPYFAKAPQSWISHAEADPDLDPLRADPRFQAMLEAARARLAAQG